MEISKNITEDEMVVEFLLAEIDSSSFQAGLFEALNDVASDEALIKKPNTDDAEENRLRGLVLRYYRGYPDTGLFEGLPEAQTWHVAKLDQDDFANLEVLNCEDWVPNLNSPRSIRAVAKEIQNGHLSKPNVLKIAAEINSGKSLPMPIIAHDNKTDKYVILEGNHRLAAYALLNVKEINVIIGEFDNLSGWNWF